MSEKLLLYTYLNNKLFVRAILVRMMPQESFEGFPSKFVQISALSLEDEPIIFLSSKVTETLHLVNAILQEPCEEMIWHKYLYTLKDELRFQWSKVTRT